MKSIVVLNNMQYEPKGVCGAEGREAMGHAELSNHMHEATGRSRADDWPRGRHQHPH